VRAWHNAGHSQDAIAREFSIDRRKVKSIIDQGGGWGAVHIMEHPRGRTGPTVTFYEAVVTRTVRRSTKACHYALC